MLFLSRAMQSEFQPPSQARIETPAQTSAFHDDFGTLPTYEEANNPNG